MGGKLESYVAGSWYSAPDEGEPLYDAATGDEVARISSLGIDVVRMAQFARTVAAPAIQELTFHERASLLKTLVIHLAVNKDELYSLSQHTGATHRDSMLDIEGGISALTSFACKATRELPNDTVLLDGALERLGREGRFVGQHVYTSRPGVAVQINAFNFPVWGMLQKLAPAFLAGMPTIVKPASQTAYLAEAVVRRIVGSGVLPEGSLQLVCGDAGLLLDELGVQDSLAFTGSAQTAGILRTHRSVVREGLTLGVEADSLNCSILGPDVAAHDPEFTHFVDSVVTEMTVKAGQKCTAIRRVIVPARMTDRVISAISERLATLTVGNPADKHVRMGPLVSLAQRAEVGKAVEALRASAEVVFEGVAPTGPGAFMAPVLLRAHKGAAEPHDVEPFGPVSTVISYDSLDDAVRLAVRGQGSLIGSLVTHDPAVARTVALGLAPWHGRILVLDRDAAEESTGHGSALPTLVHGGPGRAGGGEELGGMRAVRHHMQRTAIQASPNLMTAITGRWVAGSRRVLDGPHPFRKSLEELRVGDTIETGTRRITLDDIDHFAEFSGDRFYAHTDPAAATANPLFGGIVAHGYLIVSLAAGLFFEPSPGPVLANIGVDHLRFLTPVKPADTIRVTLTVKELTPRVGSSYGEVRWDAVVTNQDEQPVATYDLLTLVAKEQGE